MASRTPLLAILPARFAHHCAKGRGLVVRPLPFELESLTVNLVQHARNEEDPGAAWMRELIRESAKRLQTSPLM